MLTIKSNIQNILTLKSAENILKIRKQKEFHDGKGFYKKKKPVDLLILLLNRNEIH